MLVLVLGWRAAAFLVGALLFGELPVTSIGVVAADDESDMEDEGLEDNLACHNAALISDVSSRSDVWSEKLHAITLADAGKGRMTDPVPQAEADWTMCRAVPRFAVEQGTDDAGLYLFWGPFWPQFGQSALPRWSGKRPPSGQPLGRFWRSFGLAVLGFATFLL